MGRPITSYLAKSPMLCWLWLIEAPVAKADRRRRNGDDYAARVYVAFDMPEESLGAGTKLKLRIARGIFGKALPDAAVTYVWDNRNPVGTARRRDRKSVV